MSHVGRSYNIFFNTTTTIFVAVYFPPLKRNVTPTSLQYVILFPLAAQETTADLPRTDATGNGPLGAVKDAGCPR